MVDYTFTPADEAAVASATKQLVARYRRYVTYEDVQQQLYLWMLIHHVKVDEWRAKYVPKHAERTLVKALKNEGERYCRTEKAEADGYSVEDEYFYSIPMIADLLQLALDPTWMEPSGIDYTNPKTSGGKPPSEGGDLVVMVADVSKAFDSLQKADRALLEYVYGGQRTPTDAIARMAMEWGVSQSAAYNRIRRVVGRIRAALGGENPWKEIL